MRSRPSTILSLMLAFATLPMWLEGVGLVPGFGSEPPSSIATLSTRPDVSLGSPCLRLAPSRHDRTYWVWGVSETIDLEEEDGHVAVLANIGLDLLPVDPPNHPFPLTSFAPERGISLFLSLGRIRC